MAKRFHLISAASVFALLLAHVAVNVGITWTVFARTGDRGWIATHNGSVVKVGQLRPQGPAAALRRGDEVMTLDGRGITAAYQIAEHFYGRGAGKPYRLVVRRDGKPLTLSLSTVPYGLSWSSFYLVAHLFVQVLFLLAGLAVFLVKPNDKQGLLLALLFALFAGALGAAVPLTVLSPAALLIVFAGEMLGLLFWPVFLHFFLVFPEPSPVLRSLPGRERWLYLPALGMALVLLAAFHAWYAEGPAVASRFLEESPGVAWLFRSLVFGYVVSGLASLVLNYRQASRPSRRKMRVVVAGSLVGFLPPVLASLLFLLVDVAAFDLYVLRAISAVIVLSLPLVPLSFAYAIVRHQVIPVRLIVRRGVRYFLVARGFLVVEAAVVAAVLAYLLTGRRGEALDRIGGRIDIVATVAASAAVLGLLTLVHRRVMPVIDRRFFRGAYDAQSVLAEIGQAARTAGTIDEVLERAVIQMQGALHAESVALFLREEAGVDYRCAVSATRDGATRGGRGIAPAGLEAEAPIVTRLRQSAAAVDGEGGGLYLPVVTKGELMGILSFGPRLGDLPYSREDKGFLSAAAWQVAFVIENSRLVRRMAEEESLRREVEIASAVQRRLFPEAPPEMKHLDLAGLCQPAQGVGGDYYDFLPLRDGRLGIAVADVAGKGLSAALLMSIVQASLRSQAGSGDGPLSELVSSMNRLLFRSTERNSFATFFYAQFEEDTRRLTYVNAGHNPPMLFRGFEGSPAPVAVRARAVVASAQALAVEAPDEEANVVRLRSGGLVIGAVATATYEEHSLQLAAGDVLVLYTDGVTESFNAQWQEFGEERLRDAAAALLHLPAAALASAIVDRVHEWRGDAPQHDDITLVVAKVK